jgi:hypothetical protein
MLYGHYFSVELPWDQRECPAAENTAFSAQQKQQQRVQRDSRVSNRLFSFMSPVSLVSLTFTHDLSGRSIYSRHGHGPQIINVDLDDEASLDLILSASINLVAISADPSELQTSKQSYSGVYGDFCALNFALHKADPSAGT